jgi:hypothetical protein
LFGSSLPKKDWLLNSIHYCNLISKDLINDQAILYAVIDSLNYKGALPVGEVGKAISFQSNALLITRYIKDRHDGLKKFLEKYPSLFVFGDDHAYNPHVYVIDRLTPEHQQLIQHNLIPMTLLIQYRQVKTFVAFLCS